ncbi:MAG: aspartate/glutamate racemase family protein [Polaromonas sp.]|nr:aspartate/glutamate racemase family protein [Polaromonas sp.]
MKIWYQSASAYGFEPVWDRYGQTLIEQCRTVLHPDTELHVAGIPVMVRDVENWRSLQYYQNVQVMKNMQRAEAEGYDAFVIGCTLEVALAEGKSMLDIPVVGISETSYRMAMTIGRLFAIVTSSTAFTEVYGEQVERYGVAGRYLRGPYIVPASEDELATALTNPGPVMEKFTLAARRAIADGASAIVPGPAFFSTLAHRAGLQSIDGAPVIDTISLAVKTGEMLAGLRKTGLAPSRRIGVYCKPDAALKSESYARLSQVFSID